MNIEGLHLNPPKRQRFSHEAATEHSQNFKSSELDRLAAIDQIQHHRLQELVKNHWRLLNDAIADSGNNASLGKQSRLQSACKTSLQNLDSQIPNEWKFLLRDMIECWESICKPIPQKWLRHIQPSLGDPIYDLHDNVLAAFAQACSAYAWGGGGSPWWEVRLEALSDRLSDHVNCLTGDIRYTFAILQVYSLKRRHCDRSVAAVTFGRFVSRTIGTMAGTIGHIGSLSYFYVLMVYMLWLAENDTTLPIPHLFSDALEAITTGIQEILRRTPIRKHGLPEKLQKYVEFKFWALLSCDKDLIQAGFWPDYLSPWQHEEKSGLLTDSEIQGLLDTRCLEIYSKINRLKKDWLRKLVIEVDHERVSENSTVLSQAKLS